MTIISWNVNGIRACLKKGFLDFVKKYQPDILCLQETKAEKEQAQIDLPAYQEFWNSATKKGYAGTAIFTKETPMGVSQNLADTLAKKYTMTDDRFGNPLAEGRIITAEFEEFFLVNVYTPNSKPDLARLHMRHARWDPAFLEHCKLLERKKPVIFCGDLNVAHEEIDLANPESNDGKHGFTKEERMGFDAMIAAGFIDTFRRKFPNKKGAYSWWAPYARARERNVGWRIDYVLASASLEKDITMAFILPEVVGSDHCPVGIELNIP